MQLAEVTRFEIGTLKSLETLWSLTTELGIDKTVVAQPFGEVRVSWER
jgi:hypothetical protein